jgi:transcriptional regulator with XRE-family HTH domain
MDYKLLGNRIREERQKRKLTQEKLAEIIGISDSFVGTIERGDRILSLETLVKFANAFGITVDKLLQDSIDIESDSYINQFAHMVFGCTSKQKQTIIDVVRTMATHFEND